MKIIKSTILLLLLVSLLIPAMATENAIVVKETVCRVAKLPKDWNPTTAVSEESALLLALTGDRLYRSAADGSILPSLAAAMPVDVTAEYAGDSTYDIPANAPRGYAYRIDLISDGKWEDGTLISAEDWLFTLQIMVRNGWEFPLANLESYRAGAVRDADTVISLAQAGYSSEAEARAAGITSFYLNPEIFWGLDTGWQSVESRQRIRDHAIPSGLDEYFVTPAYLYTNYLAAGKAYSRWQPEFLGISTASENFYTMADVGIKKTGEHQITLILSRPMTATSLAMGLEEIFLLNSKLWQSEYGTSPENYLSCGPYRIASVTEEEIRLVSNAYWHGSPVETETLYIRPVA